VRRKTPAPKRDRVAAGVRAAIVRGDYPDGAALSLAALAGQYGVTRGVVSDALYALQREGHVSFDERHRYHVNACYMSHQLQLMQNRIERIERISSYTHAILGHDPRTGRRFQRGEGR
jgi:DNA-binding GntR family transcriptional regulator